MSRVRIGRDEPFMNLFLDDPARGNPLTSDAIATLREGLACAAQEDLIRAVLLVGVGHHFSTGMDLSSLQKLSARSPEENLADSRQLAELFRDMLTLPKIIVAAVRGVAAGGGCGLATACDFVVASENARFQYTEVKIGFVPALVSTFLLRRVPGHVARRLLLDPDWLPAPKAKELGLVDEIVPDESLEERARTLALRVCRNASPSSIAATKKLLYTIPGMSLDEALAHAAEVNAQQRTTADCRRGVSTFLQTKTTPNWLGDLDPLGP
ncbi:MAG: enoyl-CoA hydratase-related protein [Planctomycetota bacterium]